MKRKNRGAALVALAASVALTAAACSSSSGGGSDSTSGSGGGSDASAVTMSLWTNVTTGAGLKFFKSTVASFEKANPNVTIKIQSIQNEDLDGKLQTAMNSGTAPDIFYQRGGGKMQAMVDAGQVMDITDSVSAATKSAVGGSLAAESISGKVYAMPMSVLPEGFWYSKKLFKSAGITSTPTTLTELSADVTKLKSSGVSAIALGAKDAWPAAHWYYQFALRECSQAVLGSTAKDLKFTDPCWTTAANDLQKFANTKPFNTGFLTTAAQTGAGSSAGLVANHKAAMELQGAWDPGVIGSLTPNQKPLSDLAFFPFPSIGTGAGDPKAMMGGIDGYSCSAKAPKTACTDFLNYLATTPVQEAYYKAMDAPPVNKAAQSVVTEPYLKAVLKAYNQAPYVSLWLDTLYGENVGNALNTAVVNMLAGKGSPADIVATANNAAAKG